MSTLGNPGRATAVTGETTFPAHLAPARAALCETCYVTGDQLGSTRLATDAGGAVKQRRDYLPYGEEIPASASFGNRCLATDGQPGTSYNVSAGPEQQSAGQDRDAAKRVQ